MTTHKTARRWRREPGARLAGSRPLDSGKLQAPCAVHVPAGGFRLYYTAVGPARPFSACQGYILSAISDDGLIFRTEPGIRLAPQPELPHCSLRVLAPSVTQYGADTWRLYFESRGRADRPTVICSAVSADMLHWELEDGIRWQSPGGMGGPRFLRLPRGRGRLYCHSTEYGPGGRVSGEPLAQGVVSAITNDGLYFDSEPGYRFQSGESVQDSAGITAAQVMRPEANEGRWTMLYSAWQDAPPGAEVPRHPSSDPNAVENGLSRDFAAASIAADMAGYRSRIYEAHSSDGLAWEPGECVIDGDGYGAGGLDAVHAEDMSVIKIGDAAYRMYYAACDSHGVWRIVSATTVGEDTHIG